MGMYGICLGNYKSSKKNWKLLRLFKSKTNSETSATVQGTVSEHLNSRGEGKRRWESGQESMTVTVKRQGWEWRDWSPES